ncbi:hypothetical protein A3C57_02975 [Candidatus Nomurabacteria bacterium RIFCSPHIGHO2_02_FULL_33_12]|nr:MAG: hypothetical protein A3C57_02975 [Candidatus Nomurabacteria bacterium RIFCSPHIGHO2_02_FULL_33_12]
MDIFKYITKLFDIIFLNERCLICKKTGILLCKDCIVDIPKPEHDLPNYIYALYEYRYPVIKKILTDAKYRKNFGNLKIFGPYLASVLLDIVIEYTELTHYKDILIIPVPISKKRLKTRGFNQADIIAESIMANLQPGSNFKLVNNIIIKIKDRTPQASIHKRSQRLNSPKGTFQIKNLDANTHKSKILNGTLCIVIDDITTTGGTILEIRKILLEAGAQNVIGLTVAH